MNEIENLIKEAWKDFGIETEKRGIKNEYYFNTLSTLTEGRLPYEYGEDSRSDLIEPAYFLTGKKIVSSSLLVRDMFFAQGPFVALIVGQYGLGKTELSFRLTQLLLKQDPLAPKEVKPLPINLANYRDSANKLLEDVSELSFAKLFFSKSSTLDDDTVLKLRKLICDGEIFLILDGLDELTADPLLHQKFFSHLTFFLDAEQSTENLKFKVVITVRLEYLQTGIMGEDAFALKSELLKLPGKKDFSFPVYFLKLDFLDDSRVTAYLTSRLKLDQSLLNRIMLNERLFETLRRPLLLRIFCDCLQNRPKKVSFFLDSLDTQEHAVKLIETFVDIAAEDEKLLEDQENLTPYFWMADKLAKKSLELYKESKREMNVNDIRQLLGPDEMKDKILGASEDEVLSGIHKCPFLKKEIEFTKDTSETKVRFSHNVFLEYFTAKGMAEEIEDDQTNNRFDAFDELVLNIDMRKFLRGLLGNEKWLERTKKSYALSDEHLSEWTHEKEIDFEALNSDRVELLNAMTEPEKFLNKAENEAKRENLTAIIKSFLTNQLKYHPRYLLYNFEAAAICINLRLVDDVKEINKIFEVILHQKLNDIIGKLENPGCSLRIPLELLLERIISIGQRLRYKWIKDQSAKKEGQILELITDNATKQRISAIFTLLKYQLSYYQEA